jgi:hypothetical protein
VSIETFFKKNNTDCIYTKRLRENKERTKGERKQVTQQDKGADFPHLNCLLVNWNAQLETEVSAARRATVLSVSDSIW